MNTAYWHLCIQWKYGYTDWVSLKDINRSYTVELVDYAKRMKIDDDPAFVWWVPYVHKKRVVILSKVKSKYCQQTHKYGIRLPKSLKEAY